MPEWCLIRTKPRQENRAVEHLQNQHFTVYCPWLKYTGSNNKVTYEALFPGYIFLQACNEPSIIYSKVRSTRGVINFVSFGNKLPIIKDSLIHSIRQQEQTIGERKRFSKGQQVEIKDGPFKDIQAIYHCEKGSERCVILLNLINRQHKIVISNTQLKA